MTDEKDHSGTSLTEGDGISVSVPTNQLSHDAPLKMRAYWYAFGETGVRSVDLILSALCHAGKGYHHTEHWAESEIGDWGPFHGVSYIDWIQNAARDAAKQQRELMAIADQLVIEATMATNALACVARAQYQHAEVARLHIAIGLLKERLIGYHGTQSLSEAGASAQSEAQKS